MSISPAQTPYSGWSRPRNQNLPEKAKPKYDLTVRFTYMCWLRLCLTAYKLDSGMLNVKQSSRVKRYQIFIAGNAVSVINLNYKANLRKTLSKMFVESTANSNSTLTTKTIIQK